MSEAIFSCLVFTVTLPLSSMNSSCFSTWNCNAPPPPPLSLCLKCTTQISITCLMCDWFICEITDGPDRAGHWTLNTQYNHKERLLDLAGSRMWRQVLINLSVKKGFQWMPDIWPVTRLHYHSFHFAHMTFKKTSARIPSKKKGKNESAVFG